MSFINSFLGKCEIDAHHALPQTIADYPAELDKAFSRDLVKDAQNSVRKWDGYTPTPLHSLAPLADEIGVAEILYKDESSRFGLGSFKALGGAYAVQKLLAERDAPTVTVATATDGNHGRSVAWGAQQAGCKCVIYIHREVSKGREQAMAEFGAKIVRVDGDYDESVRQCAKDSAENNWEIISDTSWEGYTEAPKQVMAGYTMMVEEILNQSPTPPTHIIIQAGVGGLAGAITAAFWQALGDKLPHITIVESLHSACLMESAKQGSASHVEISEETIMAGLSCGETSEIAWNILGKAAQFFVTISDAAVPEGMRLLGNGHAGPSIEAGECGLPGIIALAGIFKNDTMRSKAAIDSSSRILVFGCEGATDAEIYQQIMFGNIA